MLAGGAVRRMAIFALGIMPYISASIIIQLMTTVSPDLEAAEEGRRGGPQGDQPIHPLLARWSLAAVQAYGIAVGLEQCAAAVVHRIRACSSASSTVITLTGGTDVPDVARRADHRARRRQRHLADHLRRHRRPLPAASSARPSSRRAPARIDPVVADRRLRWSSRSLIGFIVFMERAQRRLLVQYPKRQVGNRSVRRRVLASAAEAQRRRRDPADLRLVAAAAADHGRQLQRRSNVPAWLQTIVALSRPRPAALSCSLYAALIVFFCFFYTAIVFNPEETADNLKKYGGFIPGIRPGKTHGRIHRLRADPHHRDRRALSRRRLPAAGILIVRATTCRFYFGGTSMLIVVSVTMDTVAQIQSHLIAQQYEGLIKKCASCEERGDESDPASARRARAKARKPRCSRRTRARRSSPPATCCARADRRPAPSSGKGPRRSWTSGDLVPDDVVIGIIAERLRPAGLHAMASIFDGFPRTVAQAEALDDMLAERGSKIDRVIELKVDDDVPGRAGWRAWSQARPRRRCGPTTTPKPLRNRLGVYHKNTAPLLDYYRAQGKLSDGRTAWRRSTDVTASQLRRQVLNGSLKAASATISPTGLTGVEGIPIIRAVATVCPGHFR